MNAKEIRRIAHGFRKGVLDGADPACRCFMVSAPLAGYLEACGCRCMLVEGNIDTWQHFWIELPDGTIVDPTASQFKKPNGARMPHVYIGTKPDWYRSKT